MVLLPEKLYQVSPLGEWGSGVLEYEVFMAYYPD